MILFDGNKILARGASLELSFRLTKAESLQLWLVQLPGESSSAVLQFDLDAEGASVQLKGLYVCDGDDRMKVVVNMNHNVPACTSDQLFKGIAAGNSRASFEGLIKVAPDAQKTEAFQTNNNLQLSDKAIVTTSPQLEIYADDVKCSHGASVGFPNEDELFYMCSRGISRPQARKLQMVSFLAPVAAGLSDELAAEVNTALEKLED